MRTLSQRTGLCLLLLAGLAYGPRGVCAPFDGLSPDTRKAIGWHMATARGTLSTHLWPLQPISAPAFVGVGLDTGVRFTAHAGEHARHHLGISFKHERQRPPGPRSKARHLSSAIQPVMASFSDGRDAAVDHWSLEYARIYGTWTWQGEFSSGQIDDGTEEAQLVSGYGALSWFVSGHSRRYDAASGRVVKVSGTDANSPAWELIVRAERLHGRQRDELGMDKMNISTTVLTLANHWYLRENLCLMVNLIAASEYDHLTHARGHKRELVGRVQYAF